MLKIFCTLVLFLCATTAHTKPTHAIAMHGEPKYKPNQPFSYINSKAPIGGRIRHGVVGTFDTLNPFITKGMAPPGLNMASTGLVFEKLMTRSGDEPFSLYGLIAESVDMSDDRSWIIFNLRKEAKWSDGKPITADDVMFTHQLLRDKGRPNLRLFYSKVAKVEKLNQRSVKFTFKPQEHALGYDPELPLLVGLMTILPKHDLEGKDLENISYESIVGSGPYKVSKYEPGRNITYERRKDYWGDYLPITKGHNLFKTVHYDFYRNAKIAMEAFKAGEYDIHSETDPIKWHSEYDFPAIKDGRVVKREFPVNQPVGVSAFVYNTRKEIFSDAKVRQALGYAFDFEWLNKNLFHGGYTRSRSYFDNCELASSGIPTGKELAILKQFKGQIPNEVFEFEYNPPKTDGSGNIRAQLRTAKALLSTAGWVIKNGKLINKKTKTPFKFSILTYNPEYEKIALSFIRNLKLLGIEASLKIVDSSQFEARRMEYDYDMIINTSWGATLSPGREQEFYFSSQKVDEPGGRNYPGIKDPVVDKLCDMVATAKDRETLVESVHALDRVLLWGHYVIPLYHMQSGYLAHWDKFGHPEFRSDVVTLVNTWWSKDAENNKEKA